MKRVLVTGGAGFIGSHLIDNLLRETDWEIVSLDRLDFSGSLNRLHESIENHPPEVRKRVKIVFHDLKAGINPQVRSTIGKIDIIYHLAAGSHVDRSILYPLEFIEDNVLGTAHLLELARTMDGLEHCIVFGTDEIFGPMLDTPYKENDRLNPSNPYSCSKAAAEMLAIAYENTYGLPVIATHTMNCIGRRQAPEKYIPLCIRSIRDGLTIPIHADKTCTTAGSRFYIHADDVASAMLFIATSPTVKQYIRDIKTQTIHCPKFNIVGERQLSNLVVAQTLADIQGRPLKYELVSFHESRKGHDLAYGLDDTLMRSLGWWPKQSIHERLKEVSEWSLANPRWLNI